MIRRGVRFIGRVQGVGFRATSKFVADGFDVSGWVRNEPDGSVAMEVQGAKDEVDAFLNALHDRMKRNIESFQAMDMPPVDCERGFVIRR
ncbi:MAG: acylphosphatase [Phycisphaerales bacterium]